MPSAVTSLASLQDFAIILLASAIAADLFHRMHQPLAIGYVVVGALIGPSGPLPAVSDVASVRFFAEIGVILLMFHLGLEFSFRRLKNLGASLIAVGCVEVALMLALAFVAASWFGFSGLARLFFAALFAISSTTVIVRALQESGEHAEGFGRRLLGVLIVEDLLAVFLLVTLSALSEGAKLDGVSLASLAVQLVVVVGGWLVILALIVPRFVRRVGSRGNDEILTLLACGLAASLAVSAASFGFSTALGAFMMGSVVAESTEAKRVQHLMRPSRDLFAAIFFVSVGMLVKPAVLASHPGDIAALVAFLIVGKFVAVLIAALVSGAPLREAARMAMAMGQIGEFAFIIAGLGVASGRLSEEARAIAVAVAVASSLLTPYMIRISRPVSLALEAATPDSVQRALERYSAGLGSGALRKALAPFVTTRFLRLAVNAILIALFIGAGWRYLMPPLEHFCAGFLRRDSHAHLLAVLIFAVAGFALAAPFLFGLLVSLRRREPARDGRGPIASAYRWLEARFIDGLWSHRSSRLETLAKEPHSLAPWGAQLNRIVVHPNSPVAGLPLLATRLRRAYGLLVVAIRRGQRILPLPGPAELVLPQDELLVLCEEAELDGAREEIEMPDPHPATPDPHASSLTDFELRRLLLERDSPLSDHAVRDTSLRERDGILIVGVERGGTKILSPTSDFILRAGDWIWLVGSRDAVSAL